MKDKARNAFDLSSNRITSFVAGIIHAQPDPPRCFNSRHLISVVLRSYEIRYSLIVSLIPLSLIVVPTILRSHFNTGAYIFVLSLGVFVLGMTLCVPFLMFFNLKRSLTRDVIGIGLVQEVTYQPFSIQKFGATYNGIARGIYEVTHVSGNFRDNFEITSAWAKDITIDSRIQVLVNPDKKRVSLHIKLLKD